MPDPQQESFAQLRGYQSKTGTDSWLIAYNPKNSRKTAKVKASVLLKSTDLASRVAWLSAQAREDAKRPADTPPPPTPPDETDDATTDPEPITRAEIAERIARAVRKARTSTEITQAAALAVKVLHLDADDSITTPEPTALLAYITQAAGRTHAEIAKEIGGLTWMVQRVLDFSKAPPSMIARTLGTLTREHRQRKGTHTGTQAEDDDPNAQPANGLLLEQQSNNDEHAEHRDHAPHADAEGGDGGPSENDHPHMNVTL